jgi:hypothetical protein
VKEKTNLQIVKWKTQIAALFRLVFAKGSEIQKFIERISAALSFSSSGRSSYFTKTTPGHLI